MTDPVLVILRAIHVLGAVIWAGGTIVLASYHEYVIDPGDPERTLKRMADYDDMSTMIGASGIVAVLAGLVLYWIVSSGLNLAWITSSYGVTITIGAFAGLLAMAVAVPLVGVTNNRSVDLYEEVRDAQALSSQQADTVDRLYRRLRLGERIAALLMVIAALAMAVAQYV